MDPHHEAIERAELEGTHDLFAGAPPALAEEHGIRHALIGGAACVACADLPGNRMFNHALGLEDAGALEEIARWYGQGGWYLAATPGAGLEPELERRGFVRDYAWAKFSRPAAGAPEASTDLAVKEIGPEHGPELGRIAAQAFDLPAWAGEWLAALPGREGWHCFVAFDGDAAAATGSLYVSGAVGWVSIGATDPAFRRRGAQGALLAARLRRAHELGCEWVTTETGEAVDERPSNSYRNISRAGFVERYVRANHRAP